jgi:hypothetical protein
MKYIVMFYANPAKWAHPTPMYHESIKTDEDRARLQAEFDASEKVYREGEALTDGIGLADPKSARTVRRKGGKPVVTDGPFIESREQFAGFFTLECESMERAVEIASTFPGLEHDVVEIRPLFEWSDEG